MADPVVDCVTEDRRRGEHDAEDPDIQREVARLGRRQGRQRAGCEEERVAGQKGRDHQAGLGKDDQEEQVVAPDLEHIDQKLQILVDMQKDVVQIGHDLMFSSNQRPFGNRS